MQHITVFKKELIDQLNLVAGGRYIDATLGGGGHALELLSRLDECTLIAFDLDIEALNKFKQALVDLGFVESNAEGKINATLTKAKQTVHLVNINFMKVEEVLAELGIKNVLGIYADLGWSTEQLERIPGLSHQKDEALDMRFDSALQVSASDLLNALSERELEMLFGNYADIYGKEARALTRAIVMRRPFRTTKQLVEVITALTSTGGDASKRMQARVFQALRIAVNGEYQALQEFLQRSWVTLAAPDGVLAVITFHSGEEKLVESQFREWAKSRSGVVTGANPLYPSVDELRQNLRARSARLWRIKKV